MWPDETPSPALKRRALHAAALFHAGRAPAIIATGGLGRHPPSEAEMIARLCVQSGIPEASIFLEDQSTTTMENFRFALPILAKLKARSVLIVSDQYHLPRANMCLRHFGIECAGSPSKDATGPSFSQNLMMWSRELAALPFYFVKLKLGR